MKYIHTDLAGLQRDRFLRCDVDHHLFKVDDFFKDVPRLSQYITFIETGRPITREDYAKEKTNNAHLVVRNISNGKLLEEDLIYLTDDKAQELVDYRLEKGDIVIAISSNCGACFHYNLESGHNFTLSHYLCRIRVDETKINPDYLVYYLNTPLMQEYFRSVETGKSQKNLSKVYVNDIPIAMPKLDVQNRILSEIRPIEQLISYCEQKIRNEQNIIDLIFNEEFKFNYTEFYRLKMQRTNTITYAKIANNRDLRFSVKFHRTAAEYVLEELTKCTTKKIKHFLAEPIVLGASISPKEYDDRGENRYVSMATIKNWRYNEECARFVLNEYYVSKEEKTIRKNDILMARSGEGTIGKVALIEDIQTEGVFCDFIMRIRLKNYNPQFAYYYFRSTYFQYLIEVYKKGLGNNTNIFPVALQEFPLFDLSIVQQDSIVNKISVEMKKQQDLLGEITEYAATIAKTIQSNFVRGNCIA